MELLSAVKETFVGGDASEDAANESESPSISVKSERVDQSGTSVSSEATTSGSSGASTPGSTEADFVVATGQTRIETLLELVEAHEGRVKQVELVEITGWSKSTVSRLLSQLEDDGAIERVQIGRCKIVLLPDEPLVGEHNISFETVR